ncbi:LANO_0C05270g1_1 [Lachancea nothofagi CBS 11611]|uniref:Ribosomal RNA-processing protein 8 n=1 Tax=Lachancea nothofagi CBS 11611 TaxID=1266666 RepID=A0A1G4J816_9SACH|nr:LANO_0C05270g1_1 [Lachancea nothofagi CBS 11611]
MALFQVEGWDLKTTQVSYDSANAKKENKKKERKEKAKKAHERRLRETEEEVSNYAVEDEDDEKPTKETLAKKTASSSRYNRTSENLEETVKESVKESAKKTASSSRYNQTSENPEEIVKESVKESVKEADKETVKETAKEKVKETTNEKPPSKKRKLSNSDATTGVKDAISQESHASKKPLTALQQKMMAKLSGSRFRWINEQLYTISSDSALDLIKKQPGLFDEYHDGFRSQVQSWPENPVNVFVDQFRTRSQKPVNAPGGLPGLQSDKKIVVADMGCGEAQLAQDLNNYFAQYNRKQKKHFKKHCVVHSFDLKKPNKLVTVADIRNVPLPNESCTVVVFCLALMGTNFLDFIKEAYRLLAPRGELWVAEIKSRFADRQGDEFVNAIKLLGFFHKKTDDTNKMFTRFEFFKPPQDIIEERKAKLERRQKFVEVETEKEELETKRSKTPEGKWLLKPCIYKRR